MSTNPDTTPPANVTGLTASVASGSVTLSWTNPSDTDFAGVVIRKSTTAFPTKTTEGTEPTGSSPSTTSFEDTGVVNGTTYYYTVFALDTNQNYQTGGATLQVNYNNSEINVIQGTTNIASGGSYSFGDIVVDSSNGNITFTIQNTGSSSLSISDIVLSGTNSDQFTLNKTSTASSVSGGGSTTFTLSFNPDTLGTKNALITINNGDSDESIYTINITGRGVAPEINVQQSSTSIADGGSYDFGGKTNGTSTTAVFTIQNIGTSNLTVSSVTLAGTNASEFSLDASSIPVVVSASGSVTFDVSFNPSTTGSKTANITINNNDSDEGSYEITLNGTGVAPDTTPPAEVTGLTATAGDTQVTLNWTAPADADFDHVEITSIPATSTYTISAGTETATITGLTNGTAYTFTVMSVDTTGNKSIGESASATPTDTFTVTYDANGATGGTAPVDGTVYSSGASVTVLANTGGVIKAGYKFDGWNTSSDGTGTTYLDGEAFTGTSNITLYAKWSAVSYSLRDIGPADGYIFYVNPNYETDGWIYLEAAPASTDTTIYVWGGYATEVTGADGTAVGTGKQNTADIVAQFGATEPYQNKTYAAKICDDLTVSNGGVAYSDWFLPSKDELNLMYANLKTAGYGGFSTNLYWSSSECNVLNAWCQYFDSGGQGDYNEDEYFRVRACRAF